MAARKEILDFIMMVRNPQTRPSLESVSDQSLKIVEIYNERKADHLTLKNDMWELVTSAILNERRGIERTSSDFDLVITILLQTAADWGLYLPETEIQRYEGVKIGLYDDDDLAKQIRQIYSQPHRQQGTPQNENIFITPDVVKRDTPPEPQQKKKRLGRRIKDFKEYILKSDKEIIFARLQEQMKEASPTAAMVHLRNCIKNGTISKPSFNAFCNAFPNVKIPESTYYYHLKNT